jgi:hypothetical protein
MLSQLPERFDTDGDGLSDYWETHNGLHQQSRQRGGHWCKDGATRQRIEVSGGYDPNDSMTVTC